MKAEIQAETPAMVPFRADAQGIAVPAIDANRAAARTRPRGRTLVAGPEGVVHRPGATGAETSGDSDRAPSAKPRF